MSEEQQLKVATLINKEVENKRLIAWGNFGVELYHTEILLQLQAQEIIEKLIDPISTDKIQEAEAALATVKKEHNGQIEARKTKTARFISVTKRLMEPENSIDEAIKLNEAALLKAKLKQKDELRLKENKERELKQVAQQVKVYVASMREAFLTAHAKLLADSYKYALDNNMPIEKIPEFIEKVKARVTIASVTTELPKPTFQYNTQEAIDEEVKNNFSPISPQEYIDGFAVDINNKFSNWELALKNKPRAAELNTEELNTTVEAIADDKEKVVIVAKLEAISSPVGEVMTGKSVKEVYEIPEPLSMDEAFIIMNAFIVNKNICLPEITKIKPLNFGIKQMKAALEDVKNKDENFSFTGLKFNLIEKL